MGQVVVSFRDYRQGFVRNSLESRHRSDSALASGHRTGLSGDSEGSQPGNPGSGWEESAPCMSGVGIIIAPFSG
jgi:hypothetical protein